MTYWKFWYFKVFRSREILEVFLGLLKNERGKPLDARDATDHPPVVLADVVRAWADVRAVEVQAVGVVTSVPRSRPIVPVGITGVN